MKKHYSLIIMILFLCCSLSYAQDKENNVGECIFRMGKLESKASVLNVEIGDVAPDFELSSISGEKITLSQYRDKKNVVISFIPAAWSAVCSEQWPEYNMTDSVFVEYDAVVLGISVDNIPTLYAWSKQLGSFWFPVLSDFWPHGAVASKYGVLRSDGLAERAIFIIDKQGVIRYIDVHDINSLPDFSELVVQLQNLD